MSLPLTSFFLMRNLLLFILLLYRLWIFAHWPFSRFLFILWFWKVEFHVYVSGYDYSEFILLGVYWPCICNFMTNKFGMFSAIIFQFNLHKSSSNSFSTFSFWNTGDTMLIFCFCCSTSHMVHVQFVCFSNNFTVHIG